MSVGCTVSVSGAETMPPTKNSRHSSPVFTLTVSPARIPLFSAKPYSRYSVSALPLSAEDQRWSRCRSPLFIEKKRTDKGRPPSWRSTVSAIARALTAATPGTASSAAIRLRSVTAVVMTASGYP